MDIHRYNWFNTIIGMSEDDWIKNSIITPEMEKLKSFFMGQFKCLSIKSLTEKTKTQEIEKTDIFPEFIIYVRKSNNNDDKYFDTSSLQLMDYKTKYPVMFQVASNFNCQENSSVYTNFKSGTYLTKLMSDSTQGPFAASGAVAGAMLRLKTHMESNINLLKDTSCESDVVNGNCMQIQPFLIVISILILFLLDFIPMFRLILIEVIVVINVYIMIQDH
jgi:hypothetical protein